MESKYNLVRNIKKKQTNYSSIYLLYIFTRDDNRYVHFCNKERNVDVSAKRSRGMPSPRFITRVIITSDREDVTRSISLAKIRSRTCSLVHNAHVSVSKVRHAVARIHVEIELGFAARTLSKLVSTVDEKVRDTKARGVIHLSLSLLSARGEVNLVIT